jgi:hypothetical protein
MNSYLKDLADLSRITKELTFHCARHTFATTVTLTNGVPIETVSKMLGHKSLETTQHYAKIVDKKVSEDMRALKETIRKTSSRARFCSIMSLLNSSAISSFPKDCLNREILADLEYIFKCIIKTALGGGGDFY